MWRFTLAREIAIGEAATEYLRHGEFESVGIIAALVLGSSIVVPENLFINVACKMKRFYSNVGAAQRSLKERPEILHAVHMHAALYVSLRLVHEVMHESALHSVVVGDGAIGIDGAPELHILENLILQRLACDVRYDRGADLSQVAVKDSLHDGLACRRALVSLFDCEFHPAGAVHIRHLAAYKCFVHFQFAAFAADLGRIEGMLSQDFADSLQHEPCRRLRHSQSAAKLMRTDTVFRIRQQPKRGHPLVKADGGIFHDGLYLDRELALAGVAEPQAARLDERVLRRVAAWAYNVAIRPAQLLGILKAAVGVAKIDDGLLQRFRLWNVLSGVHVENDTTSSHVCQLVYYRL
jgi:hypothetical protein